MLEESGYVELGGLPQWVQIRGTAADNPVLLFIHGGPGGSALVVGTAWREWERDFTIVHWDQRGAGRTFAKHGAVGGESLTVERMARDGLQLADYLRARLGGRRILLVGHSWGTVVGVRMVRRKPDLFSAYVGVAQVTSTRASGALRFRKLRAFLQAQGNAEAQQQLEQLGPPPYGSNPAKWGAFQQLAGLLPGDEVMPKLPRPLPPDIWPTDRENIGRGMMFSRQQVMANGEFEQIDLPAADVKFAVPVFFFSGTLDSITPSELAGDYLNLLEAPHKAWVRFAGEGHFFLFNNPERFFAELVQRVRPYALRSEQGGSP